MDARKIGLNYNIANTAQAGEHVDSGTVIGVTMSSKRSIVTVTSWTYRAHRFFYIYDSDQPLKSATR